MSNPQPVQMLASLTKERSHEIRQALVRMGIPIDQNDLVDLDEVDTQKLKAEIAEPSEPKKSKGGND